MKLIFALLLLMILPITGSAYLLYDGSVELDDDDAFAAYPSPYGPSWAGYYVPIGNNWFAQSCSPENLSILPVNIGGRTTGNMTMFTGRRSISCVDGGKLHTELSTRNENASVSKLTLPSRSNGSVPRDYWMGLSIYIDPGTTMPSSLATTMGPGGGNINYNVAAIGKRATPSIWSEHNGMGVGLSFAGGTNYWEFTVRQRYNYTDPTSPGAHYHIGTLSNTSGNARKGQWIDVMINMSMDHHSVSGPCNQSVAETGHLPNGSTELWWRIGNNGSYTKLYNVSGIQTWDWVYYNGTCNPYGDQNYQFRNGLYRALVEDLSTNSYQKIYISNYKVGTTRSDVEYSLESSTYDPIISSWSNTKTNNSSTSLIVNVSESVTLNVTANQTISTWNWYVNGSSVSNNYDDYTYNFDSTGTKEISASGTNSNGTTNTVLWTVSIAPIGSLNTNPIIGYGGVSFNDALLGATFNHTVIDRGTISGVGENVSVGLFYDTCDDNTSDWFGSSIQCQNGVLNFTDKSTRRSAQQNLSVYTNVSLFLKAMESSYSVWNMNLRFLRSRSSTYMGYYFTRNNTGNDLVFERYNNSVWSKVANTTNSRTSVKYHIFDVQGNNLTGYTSNTSFSNAKLASVLFFTDTLNLWTTGDYFTMSGTNITMDDIRLIESDRSSGNYIVAYDAGVGNITSNIWLNISTPTTTNVSLKYREKNGVDPSWVSIGTTYTTGKNNISVTGTKYRFTEINVSLNGNATDFPNLYGIRFERASGNASEYSTTDAYELYLNGTEQTHITTPSQYNFTGCPHCTYNISVNSLNMTYDTRSERIWYNFTMANNYGVLSNVSNLQVYEGQTVLVYPIYNDDDNDTPLYSVRDCGQGSINATTGIYSWTTVDGDQGNATCTIEVSTSYDDFADQAFEIEVLDSTPVLSDISSSNVTYSEEPPAVYYGRLLLNGSNIDLYEVSIDDNVSVNTTEIYEFAVNDETNYSYDVRGYNANLNVYTAWSNNSWLNVSNAPWQILNLTNETVYATSVNLTWNASLESDFSIYEGFKDGVHEFYTTINHYNVTGLSGSTNYNFSVRANDTHNDWGYNSTDLMVTTLEEEISTAPLISSVHNYTVGDTFGIVNVTINQSNALSHVEYGLTEGLGSVTTNNTDRSVNLTGLNNNTKYYYMWVAYNSTDVTVWSNSSIYNFTTNANYTDPVYNSPALSSIVNGSVGDTWGIINLTVNQSNALTQIKYGITEALGLNSSNLSSESNRSVNLTSLSNNTKYYYSVWAWNSSDTSKFVNSTIQNFTTNSNYTAPVMTTPLISAVGNYTVSDTWGIVNATINQSDALSHVEYGVTDSLGSTTTNNTDKSVNLTGLNNNTKYYYMWFAYNSSDTSQWSNSSLYNFTTNNNYTEPVMTTPLISAVLNYTVGDTFGIVNVTINQSNAISHVEYGLTISLGSKSTNNTDRSVNLTGLSNNTLYYYMWVAYNVSDYSKWSNSSIYNFTTNNNYSEPPIVNTTPLLSDISLNIDVYWSNISYTVNQSNAETNICYGLTVGYGACTGVLDSGTSRYGNVSGLSNNTTYYYSISAVNISQTNLISFYNSSFTTDEVPLYRLNGTIAPSGSTISVSGKSNTTGGDYDYGSVFIGNASVWINVSKSLYYPNNTLVTFANANITHNVTLELIPVPGVISWENNKTSNDTLVLYTEMNEIVEFNATFNQTLTGCSWSGATEINCSGALTYAYKNFTSSGVNLVSIIGTNANGSSSSLQWTVNVNDTYPIPPYVFPESSESDIFLTKENYVYRVNSSSNQIIYKLVILGKVVSPVTVGANSIFYNTKNTMYQNNRTTGAFEHKYLIGKGVNIYSSIAQNVTRVII